MSDELRTAIEAAKIGAEKALEYFDNNSELSTQHKSDGTPVTVADPATEEEIKKHILSVLPDAKIVGEESGGSTDEESFWIIDPIDGTRIYARGIKNWAVLISYVEKGEFIIGVAYFPSLNELYYAEKGKGAYLNDKKIHVSKIESIEKALVNSGNPKYFKNINVVLDLIKKAPVVRSYETTYADCLVASGKMDASVDPYAQLWDFAPFVTIIYEAGGMITSLSGKPLTFTDRGCAMTNGLFHKELIDIVSK